MTYIEKDELIKTLKKSPVWTGLDAIARVNAMNTISLDDYVPKDFHDKTCEAMAKRHQEEIANMVSVVRCKECKHWDTADGECYADRGIYFPNPDDFCSYGEKKGADDETN